MKGVTCVKANSSYVLFKSLNRVNKTRVRTMKCLGGVYLWTGCDLHHIILSFYSQYYIFTVNIIYLQSILYTLLFVFVIKVALKNSIDTFNL